MEAPGSAETGSGWRAEAEHSNGGGEPLAKGVENPETAAETRGQPEGTPRRTGKPEPTRAVEESSRRRARPTPRRRNPTRPARKKSAPEDGRGEESLSPGENSEEGAPRAANAKQQVSNVASGTGSGYQNRRRKAATGPEERKTRAAPSGRRSKAAPPAAA